MFQDPKRGPESPGMAEHRTGERADFSSAIPNFGNVEGSLGNIPTGELQPGPSFNTDFLGGIEGDIPSAVGGMDISSAPSNVGSFGVESGAGATVGSAGSALASGAGSLTSMGVGMIPGLIGGAAGADPATMAGLNILGAAAAPAAGGAVAGAVGGTGAAAGAAGATAAAAPAAMIVGPYLVAKLIQGIQAGADKKNLFQLQKRIQSIYTQLPGELKRLEGIPALTSQLTASSSPEEAANILKQLNTLQSNFQDNGWESHLKSGATTVKTVGDETEGAGGTADLPGVQKALDAYTKQFFPGMDVARMRAQDLLERSGYDRERIAAETGRYIEPKEFAGFGAEQRYFDPESGSQAYGINYNPYMTEHYQKPGLAADAQASQQAMLEAQMRAANGESVNFANPNNFMPQPSGGMWDQEANDAFAAFKPGYTEQGLADLFGGEFMGGAKDQNIGGGLPGALPGSEIGGAGKRSPQFLTPELDNRAEAATGKLSGGRPGQQDQGSPFGMGGARRGGGMGVGAPMGGRPGGQSPFGGMSRQTMQPQQGGGVQAQRKQPSGVV